MPELFIPLFLAIGVWLGCGVASIPGEHKEKTHEHRTLGTVALLAFIAACGFGGALVSTYVAPAQGFIQ